MKGSLIQIFTISLLLSTITIYAQAPSWQWGKRGGSGGIGAGNQADNVIDMATDKNGNVYALAKEMPGTISNVDGHTGIGIYDWASVSSWDCNGNFRWMKTYGGGAGVIPVALKVDTLGGVYVAGAFYNSAGVQGPSGLAYLDPADTTLPTTNKTMFLVKYDTSGILQWLKMPQPDTISTANASFGYANDMDVAPNGDIFLYSLLTPGNYDNNAFIVNEMKMYVLRYNANGVFQSLTPLDITVSGTQQQAYGYANLGGNYRKFSRDNHNGRYYLAGYSWGNTYGGMLSFGNIALGDTARFYLTAFDSTGNSLWTKFNMGGSGLNGISYRPAIDEQSNVYVCGAGVASITFDGYAFTNNFYAAPFVIAVDSNGNLLWGSNGQNDNSAYGASAITCTNNTLGVTGSYGGELHWDSLTVSSPANIVNILLARLNAATGHLTGLDSIGSNSLQTYATSIAADKNNNFYVGGQFADQLYPANDTLYNMGGSYDWFLAIFGSANCNCTIPQPTFSYTNSGNAYNFTYTGSNPYTTISWDFGDGTPVAATTNPTHTYATSGTYHVCVTVTNACGSNTTCQTINYESTGINNLPGFDNLSIYPNPATQEIVIDNATAGTVLDIYNVIGRKVLQTTLKGTRDQIDIRGLSSGVYLMRFTDKDGRQGGSKFVKE